MNKSTDNIALSNIFSDGINIIGVVFSTLLSFLITSLCSICDYSQIQVLLDNVQHESEFTVIVGSVTIVIFLNFSLYVSGTIIKRLACDKLICGSRMITYCSILLGFLLFTAVFFLTFKFKYALKDYLFSVEPTGTVDAVINKVIKSASDVVSGVSGSKTNEIEIIRISAVLSGCLPCFTSVLSLLSVFLLYDPLACERANVRSKLLFYKYRLYVTLRKLEAVRDEINQLDQLPSEYRELLTTDYLNYELYRKEIDDSEMTARIAEYTASIELFKSDQDTVTRLSSEAQDIVRSKPPQPSYTDMNNMELPLIYLKEIESAVDLFDKQKKRTDAFEFDTMKSTVFTEKAKSSNPSVFHSLKKDTMDALQDSFANGVPDQNQDKTSLLSVVQTSQSIDIPEAMVSTQLIHATNK